MLRVRARRHRRGRPARVTVSGGSPAQVGLAPARAARSVEPVHRPHRGLDARTFTLTSGGLFTARSMTLTVVSTSCRAPTTTRSHDLCPPTTPTRSGAWSSPRATKGHGWVGRSPLRGRPGQRPIAQRLRVSARRQRLGRRREPSVQRSASLLGPGVLHGPVAVEQVAGGDDLVDVLSAGEAQPQNSNWRRIGERCSRTPACVVRPAQGRDEPPGPVCRLAPQPGWPSVHGTGGGTCGGTGGGTGTVIGSPKNGASQRAGGKPGSNQDAGPVRARTATPTRCRPRRPSARPGGGRSRGD